MADFFDKIDKERASLRAERLAALDASTVTLCQSIKADMDASLRAIVDAQHAALVARGEAVPAPVEHMSVRYELPLSRRIKPGDVLEGLHGLARGLRVTVVGPSDVGGWIVSDGSRSGHVTPESISSWRLVESAPMPVVETMIVPHEQAQAAREYLGAKYGVPHATRYTESPPADALNRWESRRHNAHCTRCYGPAFHGAGALRCERVGGCLADRDPKSEVQDLSYRREIAWWVRGVPVPYATRELAVAAWREAVIARAKREAGL